MVTDPIADLLTRIRNAGTAKHARVASPNSKLKTEVARVLKEEGYVEDYTHTDGVGAGFLHIKLKYHDGAHVITGIQRESKPGQRVYLRSDDIPDVLSGYGIAILTTSSGVITGKDAAERGVGGEYLCSVW